MLTLLGREAHLRDKLNQVSKTLESVTRLRGSDQLFELSGDLLRLEKLGIINCFSLIYQEQPYLTTGQFSPGCKGIKVSNQFFGHNNSPVTIEFVPSGRNQINIFTLVFVFISMITSLLLFWVLSEKEKRRVLEQEQERLQRESLLRFSRQVAHDIRSPLSSLQLGISALKDDDSGPELELLKLSADRINQIAADILDRSRKETVSSKNQRQVFSMKKCLKEIVFEKETLVSLAGFKLVWEISGSTTNSTYGLMVSGSETEMKRVLSNLIDNSIQALDQERCSHTAVTEPGHQGQIQILVHELQEDLSLVVEDNGPGIPPSILPHLGEIGFTYGKAHVGHGLGLSHAKSTIQKMGGKLEILSPVATTFGTRKGTRVTITLPCVRDRELAKSGTFWANELD